MAYHVIYSPRSLRDLDEITDYIAEDSPQAAARFRDSVFDLIDSLRDHPEIGVVYSKKAGVRRLIRNPVSVYYRFRTAQGAIDILHIRHDKRRPPVF